MDDEEEEARAVARTRVGPLGLTTWTLSGFCLSQGSARRPGRNVSVFNTSAVDCRSGAWPLEAADDPLLAEYMQKMGYSPLEEEEEEQEAPSWQEQGFVVLLLW